MVYNVIVDKRILSRIKSRGSGKKEPIHLLIGVKQIDEQGSSYRVYDVIEYKYLLNAGIIGTGEIGVAEGWGMGVRFKGRFLSKIQKKLLKADIGEPVELGIVHHHKTRRRPTENDVTIIKRYPHILHMIYVENTNKIYAYNGSCDILSIITGTLDPMEGSLGMFYQDLPYSMGIEDLKEWIKGKIERKIKGSSLS